MSNEIGKAIGTIRHSLNITNDNGEKVQLTIGIDFSSASDNDIKSWLASNRIIAGQRPWRKLSVSELNELNGHTFVAQNIGQKVKSRNEQISQFEQAFVNAGVGQEKAHELAMAAVDNPQLLTVDDEIDEE